MLDAVFQADVRVTRYWTVCALAPDGAVQVSGIELAVGVPIESPVTAPGTGAGAADVVARMVEDDVPCPAAFIAATVTS